MKTIMKLEQLNSIEDIKRFMNGTDTVAFNVVTTKQDRYQWIHKALKMHQYRKLSKLDKGTVAQYLMKVTGYSRSQIKRFIQQFVKTSDIKIKVARRNGFTCRYTPSELAREYERYELTDKQAKALEKLQVERAASDTSPGMKNVLDLQNLRGVGWQSIWILSMEFFNWREFKNAKQVGACAGLTPYDSGNSTREQGISKAGNKRVRKLMVKLAWLWLRYQPDSGLSQWFEKRFANGGKRMRRIGIVALARKLLVALWCYLSQGVIPEGAIVSL
jgi:transposase